MRIIHAFNFFKAQTNFGLPRPARLSAMRFKFPPEDHLVVMELQVIRSPNLDLDNLER